jgi:hypothetical protein
MSRRFLCAAALLLAMPSGTGPRAQSGGSFAIVRSTIDGGGGASSGTPYRVVSSVGQADAHYSEGSGFAVRGGFWGAPVSDSGDRIFADGFE